MGGTQSAPQGFDMGPVQLKSKDTERLELFSTVFLRLLKSTDILDVRALTKGPGACGDYTILLASDIDKEFRKIKLEGTDSGKTAIKDFLFARSKGITTESPSDQVACRALAVFYIRALQLVAALTMSIYTPPDLVNRIRNRVFQGELRRQRKNVPLSLVEKEELRIKREQWWNKFLKPTSRPDIASLGGSGQLKYNKTTKIVIYTDPENQYEYRALVGVKELETYNVGPEYMREGSYWVELYNTATKEPFFRSLVNADKSGYLFSVKPEGPKEEEPVIFNKDWTTELPEQITTSIQGVAPLPRSPNSQTRRNGSRLDPYGYTRSGGAYGFPYNVNNVQANTTRKNTAKSAANIAANTLRQEEASLQLAPTTTLPRAFQESYKSMVRWTLDISTWTEAAPASYRAVLLYIRPTLPAGAAASYLCVDNWTDKSLRYIQPFAALEALYFNKDDGSMTSENRAGLKALVDDFIGIYQGAAPPKNTQGKVPSTFDDVYMPPISEPLKALLCGKRTAQGDVMLDPVSSQILESAQSAILAAYKAHFENAYALLNRLFTIGKTETGEQTVRFADTFAKNPGSARVVLEEIIREARGVIAAHYIDVEHIYADTIKELIKPRT
jgi:hypothetical protein